MGNAPFREVHQQVTDTTPIVAALPVCALFGLPAGKVFTPCVWACPAHFQKSFAFLRTGTFKTFKSGSGGFEGSHPGDSSNFSSEGRHLRQRSIANIRTSNFGVDGIDFGRPACFRLRFLGSHPSSIFQDSHSGANFIRRSKPAPIIR